MNDTPTYAMLANMRDRALFAERELTAMTKQRDVALSDLEFRRDLYALQTKQLTAMTEQRDGLQSGIDYASDQLSKVTEQRDEAREYADRLAEGLPEGLLPKDVEVLREANLGLATELAAVTAQRDRLQKIVDEQCRFSSVCCEYREQRDEARRLAEKYRYLSCDSLDEADETLLPWETTNPNEL